VTESVLRATIDLTVVGGGAAGLATAIFAARSMPEQTVVVVDRAKKLGAKILVAGGGRCNVTNRVVSASDYCGGTANVIKRVLAAFSVERTVAFFREIGVELHEEEHGKLFPDTNQARTVLDALLNEAARCGVRILTEHRVTDIQRRDSGFRIDTGRAQVSTSSVVLATGGRSLPKSGSDGAGFYLAQALGHSLVAPTPALAPLVLSGDFHAPLSGIAQDVELTVLIPECKPVRISGAMLWTHFGVSGPAVLDASRHWHRAKLEQRNVTVTVNFRGGKDFASAERELINLASDRPKTMLRNALAQFLPARLADAILHRLDIDAATPMAHLKKDQRRRLVHGLVAWPLPVIDSRGYTYAEATAGGVPLTEIDSTTMASRKCPGLFLVGEILDVDGRIGGYNFQWAWSSAFVAAAGLARQLDHAPPGTLNRN